jgi:GntR family transcriptional regulator
MCSIPPISRGTSEPNAELRPMTRLLASDTPSRSTLRPKQIAPKPHANPNTRAAYMARGGAAETIDLQSEPERVTKQNGMATQETRIKMNQMFSHLQRASIFIGAVNKPLQIPDKIARKIPTVAMKAPKQRASKNKDRIAQAHTGSRHLDVLYRLVMPTQPDLLVELSSIPVIKNSATPIYAQIAEAVGSLLEGGAFAAGVPLPAERWWCEQYGISRMTLRQAMGILERRGLIESHRGRGTFVAHQRMQKQQQELRSFTEEIRLRGGKANSRMLSFALAGPSSEARDALGLTPGEKIYEIKRLRLKDSTPLALEHVHIPERLTPWLDRFDLSKNSLYRILEESYGLKIERSVEEISAAMPSPSCRKLLEIPPKTAVLVVNRRTFTDRGHALELTQSCYRGDLYSAVVHSVRNPKH